MALKESIRKAQKEKAYARYYSLKFNVNTDADIIERLKEQESIQGYIKRLIRADIEKEEKEKC